MDQMTIKDIARLCGMSVSTVSRAINNHPDISEETRTKVMETIQTYNYVPNNSARNLKRSETNTIAVLIKGISNPLFADMIEVLEREINKNKYSFVLQHVEESEDEAEVALQLEKEKRLKGIIFLGGVIDRENERLHQLGVPFVFSTVEPIDAENEYASVAVDDVKESCRMVDYLCECGHTRIAFLAAGEADVSVGKHRLKGYLESLESHHIPYDESLVCWTREGMPTFSMESGYQLTKELLASGKEFTCIYAISDNVAIGACKAIFDAGKRVPEDYSVAGFDGLPLASFYEPSITTVRQPRQEMAKATVGLLFDLMKKKQVKKRLVFDAELVKGESTAVLK